MRITTNAILRNYRSNLGTSMANLNTSRNKVMTGRQFVSSAENPEVRFAPLHWNENM